MKHSLQTNQEYMAYAGSMEQVAYVRPCRFTEGRMDGLSAYQVKNGPLQFTAMAGKCLDIADCSWRGENLVFFSKQGLQGRQHYDTNGQEALHSIMGGLFFTSGLENISAPCTVDGRDFAMHGRIRSTPAQKLGADAAWEDGKYVITLRGEAREGELFGRNLVLRRTIRTVLGEKRLTVRDVVENQGFKAEPLSIMYHTNFGYPLVQEGTRVLLPSKSVTPRDEEARAGLEAWDRADMPRPGEPEQVFIHDLAADAGGRTLAALYNPEMEMGICMRFQKTNLPRFYQWKSPGAGDYVMGLEPSNAGVRGRKRQLEEEGSLHMIPPFGQETFEVVFDILDGEDACAAVAADIRALL